ncbi:MAG: DMT family transporter [Candidatus Marsarchaeota archaeon]|nr:DMT family transporter [Candidatus Marsarchaeota archaeon]
MVSESLLTISILFGIASMLGYGISDFFPSRLTKSAGSVNLLFWYFSISSLMLAVVGLLVSGFPIITGDDAILIVGAIALNVLGLLTFLKGLKIGKLSIIAPISGSWSVITVLIGVIFLSEALNVLEIVGIILVIFGTLLASLRIRDVLRLKRDTIISGSEYAVATMLIWGVLFALIGVLSKRIGWLSPIFIVTVGSAVVLFVYSVVGKVELKFPVKLYRMVGLWTLTGTLAFIFYSLGTNYGYISIVSPITAASAFVAVILGVIVLRERLENEQRLGIVLIIIGIILVALG